jgi:hypothetical protein
MPTKMKPTTTTQKAFDGDILYPALDGPGGLVRGVLHSTNSDSNLENSSCEGNNL